MFDLYNIFEDFLYSHYENKSVCFLCKKHHNELGRKEKEGAKSLAHQMSPKNIKTN